MFLGLLAGREFALSMYLADTGFKRTLRNVSMDALKALSGLIVSVILALGLPYLNRLLFGS